MDFIKKMRAYFVSRWRKRREKRSAPTLTSNQILPLGPSHAQTQSLLFAMLPAELRLLIYTAFLVGPGHLLHILREIPDRGELASMGHWRCGDLQSPYLIWQHHCFGGKWPEGETKVYWRSPTSSDLLALLRTCRLVYVRDCYNLS
jgi:hypothetical protein